MRRAVVVGINTYQDKTIPPLNGAYHDANEIGERLKESGDFQIDEHHRLLNGDATCARVRKAISDLLWTLEENEVALFYFSGHGFQDSHGNGYLAPYDMAPDEPFVSGIRIQELRELVLQAQHKTSIVVILDCCYSGIATEGKSAESLAAEDPRLHDWFAPLNDEADGSGRIILASSGKDKKSHEIKRSHEMGGNEEHPHGVFTYHLLEAMDGKAAEADWISVDGLRRYVDRQMKSNNLQKPSFFGAGLRNADEIRITRPTQRIYIKSELTAARDYFSRDEPLCVFSAAKRLGRVLAKCPTLEEARDLRTSIDQKLQQYKGQAMKWFLGKKITIGPDYPEECKFLEFGASNLSVQSIAALGDQQQTLLASLCQASAGLIAYETFVGFLDAARQGGSPVAISENRLLDAKKQA